MRLLGHLWFVLATPRPHGTTYSVKMGRLPLQKFAECASVMLLNQHAVQHRSPCIEIRPPHSTFFLASFFASKLLLGVNIGWVGWSPENSQTSPDGLAAPM